MRIFLTAVSLAFLLSVGAGVKSARSENATFKVTNSAPNIIHVKLFSQSRRGWQWPSSKGHWILDDSKQHNLTAGNSSLEKRSATEDHTKIKNPLGGWT